MWQYPTTSAILATYLQYCPQNGARYRKPGASRRIQMTSRSQVAARVEGQDEMQPDRHIVIKFGLSHVRNQLSRRGWKVMHPAGNARGVDFLTHTQDGLRKLTIKVRASRDVQLYR